MLTNRIQELEIEGIQEVSLRALIVISLRFNAREQLLEKYAHRDPIILLKYIQEIQEEEGSHILIGVVRHQRINKRGVDLSCLLITDFCEMLEEPEEEGD